MLAKAHNVFDTSWLLKSGAFDHAYQQSWCGQTVIDHRNCGPAALHCRERPVRGVGVHYSIAW